MVQHSESNCSANVFRLIFKTSFHLLKTQKVKCRNFCRSNLPSRLPFGWDGQRSIPPSCRMSLGLNDYFHKIILQLGPPGPDFGKVGRARKAIFTKNSKNISFNWTLPHHSIGCTSFKDLKTLQQLLESSFQSQLYTRLDLAQGWKLKSSGSFKARRTS